MRRHVRIVAYLHIALGVLGLLVGLGVLTLLGGMAFFTGGLANLSGGGASFATVLLAAMVAFVLLSVPSIIGGLGLLRFRPWARTLMILISALDLVNFPLGTAIGAYGLVILFNDDTRRLFEPGGAYNSAARSTV